ncbi:MAG: hypothetical protein ACOVMP_01175 [Chthoniobacterales bacterium]
MPKTVLSQSHRGHREELKEGKNEMRGMRAILRGFHHPDGLQVRQSSKRIKPRYFSHFLYPVDKLR